MKHKSASTGSAVIGVLQTMRPHQWVKNLFVLAPLFFAQAFWQWELVVRGITAALLFCLMAGTVYLINDIADRQGDRSHPTKRHRPIASGRLAVGTARMVAWLTGLGSLAVAFVLNWKVAAVLAIYLLINVAYSNILKHWAFVDVGVIAAGFVLRVVAGSLAVGVFLSEWLVLCTFLLACFLGLGKRRHELGLQQDIDIEKSRKGWKSYDAGDLEVAQFFVGTLTVAGYTIYALTASLPDQPLRTEHTPFSSPLLPVTIPLVALGLARFYQLAKRHTPKSPTDQMLRDPILLGIGIVWLTILVALGWG